MKQGIILRVPAEPGWRAAVLDLNERGGPLVVDGKVRFTEVTISHWGFFSACLFASIYGASRTMAALDDSGDIIAGVSDVLPPGKSLADWIAEQATRAKVAAK